jgi:hypothetical protein
VARKKLPEPCPNKYVKTGEEKKKSQPTEPPSNSGVII